MPTQIRDFAVSNPVAQALGAEPLKAEKSHNYTLGAVYAPGAWTLSLDLYQITIGGRADEKAELGVLIGPAVKYAEVADVIEDIVEAYLALRARPDELFVDTVKRLGVEPFKERVYATR